MLHAIVMAGGSGTRFWPKSRRSRPKQLLRLHGDRTMLQQTVDRIASLTDPSRTWIITGEDQAEATREQLPELPQGHVVGEPCARDTAACVGLAAAIVERTDPDGTMIVMPADHVIAPVDAFHRTVEAALEIIDASPSTFVAFGIAPTRPETGYGYIERGDETTSTRSVRSHRVVRFREKPDRATAEEFLRSGRFAWNSGIFVWRAAAIRAAIDRYEPALGAGLRRISKTIGTPAEVDTLQEVYPSLPRLPIDKAVMEQADDVQVLEVSYEWNDVGDWRALANLVPSDSNGNSVQGPVVTERSSGCILVADDGGPIVALGVSDLVIVQSGGATLVARKDQMDHLKSLVEGFGAAGFGDLL